MDAYDKQIPQVNFDGADFRGSVFADTFSHVLTMAFSRDGQYLATFTIDGEVHVWQASDGRLKAVFVAPEDTIAW